MALRLSASQIATEALRVIGEISPRDPSARANVVEIALRWLDIEVAHLCATNPIDWMVPEAIEIPLIAGTFEYAFGTDDTPSTRPDPGVEFLIQAMVIGTDGARDPLEIKTFTEYEALAEHGQQGTPTLLAFNRKTGKIYVDQIPAALDENGDDPTATGVTIEILVQTFSPDQYQPDTRGAAFALRQAWQKWAILATAYAIGRGPVRRIPQGEAELIRKDLAEARDELLAFENDTKGRDKRVSYHQPM